MSAARHPAHPASPASWGHRGAWAGATPASRLVQAVAVASGLAGLGYEIVWAEVLTVALGHEVFSVLAVLCAFFVGLGLGGVTLGGAIRRSGRPHTWFAVLELAIGAWALAFIALIPWLSRIVPTLVSSSSSPAVHALAAFATTLVLLFPATFAMGATLPALERVFAAHRGPGLHVPRLYAANTFGAVLGTLASTFIVMPAFGFTATLAICALVNLTGAAVVWKMRGAAEYPGDGFPPTALGDAFPEAARPAAAWLAAALVVTGFAGIAFEILVVRVLSQVLENTVYTFAAVLSVYLTGTALGATWYHARLRRKAAVPPSTLLAAVSGACLFGTLALYFAPAVYRAVETAAGGSTGGALLGDVLMASLAFGPATLAMGALFSHLVQAASSGIGIGRAIGLNTLGAATAPGIAGLFLMPALGAKFALLTCALAYLIVLPGAKPRSTARTLAPIAALAVALLAAPPLRFVTVPDGGELLAYEDGVMASVAVVSDAAGTRHLKVNNHYAMGSTSSGFADHRQTHLPLVLHPAPRNALFLGVGTGMSLDAARYHADLKVTAVELVPEVLELLRFFGTSPETNGWPAPPRLVASDARRFVVGDTQAYDVVIADLFHPSRDGAGFLYTREHFSAVRDRLADDGLFCQWLPLFQMDLETFRLIARTFSEVFPHVEVWLPHYSLRQPIVGLIGSETPLQFEPGWLEERVLHRPLQRELVQLRLNSDLAMLGGFVGDENALTDWVGSGPVNVDRHPRVNYHAPAFAYRDLERADHGPRLLTIVEGLGARRRPPVANAAWDSEFGARLTAYLAARDAYLEAGIGITPDADLAEMLEKTRGPLLEAVRLSDEFMPAYGPLMNMAVALYETDPGAGRALIEEIADAAPGRPEARRLLDQIERRDRD